ncbi:hypothetical protein, partial [Endozoicomonas montiporae]|uniref:hypothetical protein n=1 Tax=Endozoicomonas montiporae TaxID=1027273 RepID=UPI000556D325
MNHYINKAGLALAAIASFYLTAELFLSMSTGTTALIFLLIGLAAELGKYRAIVGTTTHHQQGNTLTACIFGLTTFVLIMVSLAGSVGALLATDNQPTASRQILETRIADIDQQINLERKAMTRAADVNAQTAGVAPARASLDRLHQQKDLLLSELETTPTPEPTALDAIVSAVSAETDSNPNTVLRIAAFLVALLLEGLCLLFAVANTTDRLTDSKGREGRTTQPTTVEVIQEETTSNTDDRFPVLVAAIQAKEIKPTYDN